MSARLLPRVLRRRAFPFVAPTWPTSVQRPPVVRSTGTNYDTEWGRRYGVRLARALVLDSVGKGLARVVANPRIQGADRIATLQGPAIFAANHASHIDTPLLLTSLPDRFRHRTAVAAGADYFFDKRWKGAMWTFLLHAVPIERLRVSPTSMRQFLGLLDSGWSLVIFPEGGRSPHGWGQPHSAGPAFLANRAGVPVVPVHLEGTRRILPKDGDRLRFSDTLVTFGSALRTYKSEDPRDFAVRIERAVAELADERTTDWWSARRRAAAGTTPSLTGPDAGAWRRTWALGENRRRAKAPPSWP